MIVELHTRHGIMFIPDTDQCQYDWMAGAGVSPEEPHIDMVSDLLAERPKGVVIDVGANFGAWTVPMAKYALTVIAYEPQQCCSDLIERSLKANSIKNVYVYNSAIGSYYHKVEVPQLSLDVDTNFGGISLVGANECQVDVPTRQVSVWTIDGGWTNAKVSFIKIDVEGGELDVLKGAAETIARDQPIIFLEYDHKYTDLPALEAFIQDAGYTTLELGGNYLCMPL